MGSPEFWKRPYRVPASSDPDTATAQTIGIMAGHVRNGAGDPWVQHMAQGAASQFAGLGAADDESTYLAGAAWWWCKLYVKFVHHEFIIRQLLGESGHLQGLIAPEVLVRMQRPEGDCAIFSECVAAFLTVYGIPYEFVTVAVNPNEPEEFSHVYLYAVLPSGDRLPLDASHGDYPGWQVPTGRVFRRQVWDSDGNPVPDRGSRFDGLHNYGLRGLGGGLGTTICDETGFCYDDGIVGSSSTAGAGQQAVTVADICPDGTTPPCASGASAIGGYVAPSQSNTAQWAAFSTQLLKAGLTLAEINAIQPGTVVGANGQILRQSTGYAVPVGSTTSLNTALGGNGMLYLGLAAVVVVLMSMGKR